MNNYENLHSELRNMLHTGSIFDSDTCDSQIEPIYHHLMTSTINKLKCVKYNSADLNSIQKMQKDVVIETKEQYRLIMSCCEDSKKTILKTAIRKYNFLHFLKHYIQILNANEEYETKVKYCKYYFNNRKARQLVSYLYTKNKVSEQEIVKVYDIKKNPTHRINDLLVVATNNNVNYYSLSPRGRSLYAFFVIRSTELGGKFSNDNEAKTNDVLEYLIQYLLAKQELDVAPEKPILYSSSAGNNLNRLIALIDSQASYNTNLVQQKRQSKSSEGRSINWKGGRTQW